MGRGKVKAGLENKIVKSLSGTLPAIQNKFSLCLMRQFKSLLFILSLLMWSCTHKAKTRQAQAVKDKRSCQALLNDLPSYKKENGVDVAKRASKTGLHYLAVGTGAIADVVVIFAAGIAVGVTVCSPMLIADSLAGGRSNATGACVDAFMKSGNFPGLYDFPITTFADGKTYHLTCPDFSEFEKKLTEVLKCRDNSLPPEQIKWQVEKILSDKTLKKCMPSVAALL